MKKSIFMIMTICFLIMISIPVNAVSEYYKDIKVTFNHNGCNDYPNKDVKIQLFANNKKEGSEITLNKTTGFTYTFKDLPIFEPHSPEEIIYDVKILENGSYRLISEKKYTYETKHISKWVQILPEDIKAGHTYVITTDNWNYENNGFSKTIYLRGDITAKGAAVEPEYNIVDGKQSYYIIDGEPIANTKWVVSNVPSTDPNYSEFKNYLMFTNEAPEEKKLTLTGYKNGNNINYIFKRSGQVGLIDDNTYNTNKVFLTPVANSKGRFYIGTHTLFPDIENVTQYITLSGQNQYQSGSNIDNAAQFKAYEHIDKDVKTGVTINVSESLCPKDTVVINRHSEFNRKINVKFDCSGCKSRMAKGVTIQLFADGKKVEDEQIKLNNKTGFTHTFDNLPIFQDDSFVEIKYDVKAYINGKYYAIPKEDVSYQKQKVHKWIQVLPQDLKAGHTYVLISDNLNYADNGYSKFVYLRGDITAKGASIKSEYNVIDNKKTYYVLDGEPIENTKWTVSNVPSTDDDYNEFKDYLMLTNETEDKKLTLTGYISDSGVNFIYKRSSKNGYIDSENAMYTNKVKVIPINDSNGRFYIGTKNLLPEPNNMMQYITLNNQNQFQAGSTVSSSAQFRAFEYVDKEVILVSEIVMKPSLCEMYKMAEPKNPNTAQGLLLISLMIIITAGTTHFLKRKNAEEL